VESGVPDNAQNLAWQTCSCIGSWHYNRALYENNGYKSVATVIHMLVDIVSKNGNLLLSVPVRGDGTIDEKEVAILEGIAVWMDINKESIFNTRPWKIFGEGPAIDAANSIKKDEFNAGKVKFSDKDVRYTQNRNVLYAITLGVPTGNVSLKSLGKNKGNAKIKNIEVLGSKEKLSWKQDADSLVIIQPKIIPNNIAIVFKIREE
jgi:alpha-L-fucosidase